MAPRELPPKPKYDDLPYWSANFDNPGVRAVNEAWNRMLNGTDLSEISFADLAKVSKVTTPALYQHFASLEEFAIEMTAASIRTLWHDLISAYEKSEASLDAYEAWLRFASRRPLQYLLALSPRFKDVKRIAKVRGDLQRDLDLLLKMSLDREPRDGEMLRMNALLTGGGVALANGNASVKELLATVTSTLTSWKKTK